MIKFTNSRGDKLYFFMLKVVKKKVVKIKLNSTLNNHFWVLVFFRLVFV